MGLINFLKQKFSKHKDEKPSEAAAPSQKEEPKKEDNKININTCKKSCT